MKSYLIAYDLIDPGQNYQGLMEEIIALGHSWDCLNSTWIVKSDLSSKEIRDILLEKIDYNDKLLVVHLTGEAAWTSN